MAMTETEKGSPVDHACRNPGWPGMGRMYKRVNDFPIRKGGRPPCDQKRAQVHGAPLTRRAENPTIALSHPFELPDSIFDAFTSPPRVSPAVELRSKGTRGYR